MGLIGIAVTSVLGDHNGRRGRDRVVNESEEELTGDGRGIQIIRRVEIKRREEILGRRKEERINSIDLGS
jgi:hypothetical protein